MKKSKTRCQRINSLFKRKLIPSARFSNEMIDQHRLRLGRTHAQLGMPKPFGDTETPEDVWERAGERIQKMDPNGSRARKVFRKLIKSSRQTAKT